MKTTYVSKNAVKEEERKKQLGDINLQDVYLKIRNTISAMEMDKLGSAVEAETSNEELANVLSNVTKVENSGNGTVKGKSTKEVVKPNTKGKTKKSFKKVWLFGIVSLLVIVLIVAVYLFSARGKSYKEMVQCVNRLYTSSERVDVKDSVTFSDLENVYSDLCKVNGHKSEVESLEAEVNTIGYYIQDKATLDEYSSEEFNLCSSNLSNNLVSIKDNLDSYVVPTLVLSISDRISMVQTEYSDFINLRLELQSISVDAYDDAKYTQLVQNVRHKSNREELEGMLETIRADKATVEAKRAFEQAKDDAEKEATQKALSEAQELQKQAQEKLQSIQKELESAIKEDTVDSVKSNMNTLMNGEFKGDKPISLLESIKEKISSLLDFF